MSKTVGNAKDSDFRLDLEIVVRKQPGYGAALQRLFDRGKATHQGVADHLNIDRSTVSKWVSEERWPRASTLLEVLKVIRVDTAMLNEAAKVLLGGDTFLADVFRTCGTINTFSVTEEQIVQLIKEQDDFEQLEMLFRILRPVVTMRQGLRAAGLKGGEAADPKAAKWFSEEYDKHQVERQAKRRGWTSDDDSVLPAPYARPNREAEE